MLIAVATIWLAAAQSAPSGADVACILAQIPSEARAVVLDEATSGEPGPARESLYAAARSCAREQGWTAGRETRSGNLAAIHMIISEATARLERNGLPPRILLDWYEAQPASVREKLDGRALDDLVAHLARAGILRDRLEANAGTVGALFAALEQMQRVAGNRAD